MNSKKIAGFGIGMMVLSIGSRCFFFPNELGHYDSFNFAFALDFYHLPSLSPHFPGYPWYILIAKCFYHLGCSKIVALILPGLIASILSIWLLWKIAEHYRFSLEQKVILVLFYAWNPLVSITSLKAFSDSLALFFFLLSFYHTLQIRSGSAGFWSAIGIGVRPSDAILILPILWQNRFRLRWFLFSFSIASLPLLYFYSVHLSWNEVKFFIFGHFTQWGGTVWTSPSGANGLWLFWTHVLGGYESGRSLWRCVILFILIVPLWKDRSRPIFFPQELRHWLFCYGVWVFVAQNLSNPRHFLPFLFPLAVVLSGNIQKRFGAICLLLIPYSLGTLAVLQDVRQPSLYIQFSDLVLKRYTPLDLKIYGGKLLRVFDEPLCWKWNKKNVVHFSEVQTDLTILEYCPPVILITSEVRSIPSSWKEKADVAFKLVCSSWSYAPEHEVYLYQFSRDRIQFLLTEEEQ